MIIKANSGKHLLKVNSLRFLAGKTSKRRFFDLKYNTTVQICLQNVLKRKMIPLSILLSYPTKRCFYDFRLYLLQFHSYDFPLILQENQDFICCL